MFKCTYVKEQAAYNIRDMFIKTKCRIQRDTEWCNTVRQRHFSASVINSNRSVNVTQTLAGTENNRFGVYEYQSL